MKARCLFIILFLVVLTNAGCYHREKDLSKTIDESNNSVRKDLCSTDNMYNDITHKNSDINLEKLFTLDDIKSFILEANSLEDKLSEGDVYSSSTYIGMVDGTYVCEYTGKYDTFGKVQELFKDYYTDEVIEKILVRNGLVNIFGTIGIIAADGEPFYWINNHSRIKILINENYKKVVEIEEFSDIDDAEFWEYTLEKQDSGNWLITDIEGCMSYDETKKQLYYYKEFSLTSSSQSENYPALYVLDDNITTAWVEGVDGDGIGEWIKFKSSINQNVSGIMIINGYVKSHDLYYANNRIKRILVELSDNTIIEKDLNDNTFDYQTIKFKQPVDVKSIKITILEVYLGNKYNDTCISEIRLYR